MARRITLAAAAIVAALLVIRAHAAVVGAPAIALFAGEREAQQELARGVDRWARAPLDEGDFSTGSSRYDGEWLFATRMFAVLGYAQISLEHPELADHYADRIDICLEALVADEARAFDAQAWGRDPLEDLGSERPHVAYLGYLALALAVATSVHPETPHAALLGRIVEHLTPLFEASASGLLETYPSEVYPIDNTSFIGALGLYDRMHDEDHSALIDHFVQQLQTRYRDPDTGLLHQSVTAEGEPVDAPRGSGTALAAYYLSFADAAAAERLWRSIASALRRDTLGYGTVREYAEGAGGGLGDIDSGPVVLGQGVSATGFSIGLARMFDDAESYRALYATAAAVGAPVDRDGTHFALGGPIGDSILFAMLTAQPPQRWERAR